MAGRSNATGSSVNYGFHGARAVHTLALAGAAVLGAAAFILWDVDPWAPWLAVAAVIGAHLGVGLLLGSGALAWLFRVGRYVLRDRMLALVPWRGDEHVLDVGCGAGIMLIAAAKRLSTGRAVGIDLWTGEHGQTFTADTVRANAAAEGVGDRVEVRDGDARDMDFPDAVFDVVLSSFVLHHIDAPGRRAATREMVRVLKPGGRLVLLDVKHIGEIAEALRAAGAVDVERTRVFPGAHRITARKPEAAVAAGAG